MGTHPTHTLTHPDFPRNLGKSSSILSMTIHGNQLKIMDLIVSQLFLGILGVNLIHSPKLCAGLRRTTPLAAGRTASHPGRAAADRATLSRSSPAKLSERTGEAKEENTERSLELPIAWVPNMRTWNRWHVPPNTIQTATCCFQHSPYR